jgi:hypothetical protein
MQTSQQQQARTTRWPQPASWTPARGPSFLAAFWPPRSIRGDCQETVPGDTFLRQEHGGSSAVAIGRGQSESPVASRASWDRSRNARASWRDGQFAG